MYDGPVLAVPPDIITHNAQFTDRTSGQTVILRGVDITGDSFPKIVDKLGNVNFVRIRVNWADIEPTQGSFSEPELDALDNVVEAAEAEHIEALIDFHFTSENPMPAWAQPAVPASWWTSSTSAGEFEPFVEMMVRRYSAFPNVIGYELWNEPQWAPATAAGTDEVIRWQAGVINDIRKIDKQRAIVVMLRGGWDQGLRHANLHHFGDTHHLVLDFHDQFCGCVGGDGYTKNGEAPVAASNTMTNNEIKPYTGTSASQALHLAYADRWVKVLNRPVLVGEFEVQQDDPNGATFQDQLTGLMAQKGYSWARWQGPGTWTLAVDDWGALNPEGQDLANILAGTP